MVSTLDTSNVTDGFQPTVDLRERATDDENYMVFIAVLAAVIAVAYYICRFGLHGSIAWRWGIPYCRY